MGRIKRRGRLHGKSGGGFQMNSGTRDIIVEKDWRAWAVILLICCAGLMLNGYEYGALDSTLYVPIIAQGADPSLFPNDYLFQETSRELSLWFPAMSFLAGELSVEWAFFWGYVASILALYIAIYHLSLNLFSSRPAAFISICILACQPFEPGSGGAIYVNVHTVQTPAAPVAIVFFIAYCRGRFRLAALLAGGVFLIHPITAVPCICMLGLGLTGRLRSQGARAAIGPLLIFFAAASPLLVKALVSGHFQEGGFSFFQVQDQAWNSIIRGRLVRAFPGAWGSGAWANFILMILGLAGLLILKSKDGLPDKGDSAARDALVAAALLFAAAFVFADLIPIPAVVQMQLGRSSSVIVVFLVIYSAWFFGDGVSRLSGRFSGSEKSPGPWAASSLVVLTCFGAMLFWLENRELGIGHLIALLIWLGLSRLNFGEGKWGIPAMVAGLACMLFLIFFPAQNYLTLGVAVAVILFLEGCRLAGELFLGASRRRLMLFNCLAAPIAFIVLSSFLNFWSAGEAGQLGRYYQFPWIKYENDWISVQKWAKNNTPVDAVFLTPYTLRGFRVHSLRSIAGEWKDGGPAIFSRDYALEWASRRNELMNLESMGSNSIVSAAGKYGCNYMVVAADNKMDLQPVYKNRSYAVYAVDD